MTVRRRAPRSGGATAADRILGTHEASLLDVVDNVLSKGVVLTGDVTLALAHVDLIYARVSLLLSAADRVLPGDEGARRRVRGAPRAGPRPPRSGRV